MSIDIDLKAFNSSEHLPSSFEGSRSVLVYITTK